MPSTEEENQPTNTMYTAEEDLEDEEDLEETDEEEDDEEEDEELDDEEDLTKPEDFEDLHSVSTITTTVATTTVTATPITTVAPPKIEPQPITVTEPSSSVATEEKKPSAFDDSRRLFQRLWTDEDEIGLLQGFLEFTTQRGFKNSAYHHDTAPFYDQIKSKLQLDFNKSQLVEKLRRLKKKYRNVMNRVNSGKDFSFKSPHDQATFEISRKIWSGIGLGEAGIEDDEGNAMNSDMNFSNGGVDLEKKVASASTSRSRKRSRTKVVEENVAVEAPAVNLLACPVNSSLPNVIEDTVRSCLSPLIKELLSSGVSGSRGLGSMALSPLPLNFGGNTPMNFGAGGEVMDEKWRKQQILELEVYAKRMELVQEQIKVALEELRSTGGR